MNRSLPGKRRATSADTFAKCLNAGALGSSLSQNPRTSSLLDGKAFGATRSQPMYCLAAPPAKVAPQALSIAFILLRLARSICCGQEEGGSNHCWVAVKFIAADCAQSISACGPLLLKYCWPPPFTQKDIKNSDCRQRPLFL